MNRAEQTVQHGRMLILVFFLGLFGATVCRTQPAPTPAGEAAASTQKEATRITKEQAGQFYSVHAERSFFGELVAFMISGPVVVQVLEGDNAVARNREIMGATNPANAAPGTIRADFAESVEANSVHGSDSAENAAIEIAFFFSGCEIAG